jgi:hypothetical protein
LNIISSHSNGEAFPERVVLLKLLADIKASGDRDSEFKGR